MAVQGLVFLFAPLLFAPPSLLPLPLPLPLLPLLENSRAIFSRSCRESAARGSRASKREASSLPLPLSAFSFSSSALSFSTK